MVKPALYIVATPLGNLQDISYRAVDILSNVDKIAAEDTRHSKKLLMHYGINTPCTSLHEYNEEIKAEQLITFIKSNKSLALISDAGTPLISDPGYRLVALAKQVGIDVIPVPGPSALITALCASGLPANKFIFMGFLPVKENARTKILTDLATTEITMIFYEAPHRLLSTLKIMKDIFGKDRNLVLARELTKIHEKIIKDSIGNILNLVTEDTMQQKGEIVVIIEGYNKPINEDVSEEVDHIIKSLIDNVPMKQAIKIAVQITGLNKNIIYKRALEIKNMNEDIF